MESRRGFDGGGGLPSELRLLFNMVQTTLHLNHVECVCVEGGSRTGLGTGSSLSSSLTQQCTCDHSGILFESIKVLSGGFRGGWASPF